MHLLIYLFSVIISLRIGSPTPTHLLFLTYYIQIPIVVNIIPSMRILFKLFETVYTLIILNAFYVLSTVINIKIIRMAENVSINGTQILVGECNICCLICTFKFLSYASMILKKNQFLGGAYQWVFTCTKLCFSMQLCLPPHIVKI